MADESDVCVTRKCTVCLKPGHNRKACEVLTRGLADVGLRPVTRAEIATLKGRRCSACRHTGHIYPACPVVAAGLRLVEEEAAMVAEDMIPAAAAATVVTEDPLSPIPEEEDDPPATATSSSTDLEDKFKTLEINDDDECDFCHHVGHTREACTILKNFERNEKEAVNRAVNTSSGRFGRYRHHGVGYRRRRRFGHAGSGRGVAPGRHTLESLPSPPPSSPRSSPIVAPMTPAEAASWAVSKLGLTKRRDASGWCYTLFVQGSLSTKIGKTKNIGRRTSDHHTTAGTAVVNSVKCTDFHTTEKVALCMVARVAERVTGTSSAETFFIEHTRAMEFIRAATAAVDSLHVRR